MSTAKMKVLGNSMPLYSYGSARGKIVDSDTESTLASECEGIKLYHCWACGSLRFYPHGGCNGTMHQCRRSTCDGKPVTKEHVERWFYTRVFYWSKRLNAKFEGWLKAHDAALEDVLHNVKRLQQLDAVREQIAALKMQEKNLESEKRMDGSYAGKS